MERLMREQARNGADEIKKEREIWMIGVGKLPKDALRLTLTFFARLFHTVFKWVVKRCQIRAIRRPSIAARPSLFIG